MENNDQFSGKGWEMCVWPRCYFFWIYISLHKASHLEMCSIFLFIPLETTIIKKAVMMIIEASLRRHSTLEELNQSQIWENYEMSLFLVSRGLWDCCILKKKIFFLMYFTSTAVCGLQINFWSWTLFKINTVTGFGHFNIYFLHS